MDFKRSSYIFVVLTKFYTNGKTTVKSINLDYWDEDLEALGLVLINYVKAFSAVSKALNISRSY